LSARHSHQQANEFLVDPVSGTTYGDVVARQEADLLQRVAIRLTDCIAGMRGGTVPAATASHEVKGLKLRSNREASEASRVARKCIDHRGSVGRPAGHRK
jgi:hypothetical protein